VVLYKFIIKIKKQIVGNLQTKNMVLLLFHQSSSRKKKGKKSQLRPLRSSRSRSSMLNIKSIDIDRDIEIGTEIIVDEESFRDQLDFTMNDPDCEPYEMSSASKEENCSLGSFDDGCNDCRSVSSDSDSSYKDGNIVTNVEDLKLDTAHCNSVGDVLIDKGIIAHFNSLCGGKQKPGVLKYIVRRTSQLLVWTYFYQFLVDLKPDSVIQWYAELIESHYLCLERFVTGYLDEIRGLSASTCYNYLCDITKSFKWFIWYRHNRRNEYPVDGTTAGGFADLLSQLRKNLKPAQQKQRVANTLRNMVANNRFPKGGIHELRQHLEDGIQWAISVSPDTIINRKLDYNRFLSIIVNALYLFSPQGRIGGCIFDTTLS